MFRRMKGNRIQSQPPGANAVRLARSIEEEEAEVAAQACECAGTLRIKKRISRNVDGQTLHYVDLECDVCFQCQQWTFKYEGDAALQSDEVEYDEFDEDDEWSDEDIPHFSDAAKPEFRQHHYQFAHRILPQIVFEDPDAFYEVMQEGMCVPVLEDLWRRVGEHCGQPIFTPSGEMAIKVRAHDFLGRSGVVIELPEPQALPEAWYIAIISDDQTTGAPWRYLVLEDTNRIDENPRAILCEWFDDGSRQNHSQTVVPSFDNMVRAVERHLTLEEKRRYAGLNPGVSTRWLPGVDSGSPPEFDNASYRIDLCRFSFITIPEALANNPDGFINSIREGNGQEFLQTLWLSKHSAEGINAELKLSVSIIDVADMKCAVIQMPEPLAPPEPYFIGFAIPSADLDRTLHSIYTLEMASVDQSEPPLLCWVTSDGSHAVSGQIVNVTVGGFAEVIAMAEKGDLPRLNSGNTLKQLMLYSDILSQS